MTDDHGSTDAGASAPRAPAPRQIVAAGESLGGVATWCFEAAAPIDPASPLQAQLAAIREARLVYCDPGYAEAHGQPPAALLGRTFAELSSARGEGTLYALWEGVARGYRVEGLDLSFETPAGDRRILRTSAFGERDAAGRPFRIWGRHVDVTELHVTRRARDHLEERLRLSSRLEGLGAVIGGAAHDLNNLLTAILAGAELLDLERRAGSERAVRPETVAMLRESVERARDLTTRLVDLAREEPPPPVELDLSTLVRCAGEWLARALGGAVYVEVRADGPLRVRGQPVELERVLLNLAINARDAMPRGGRLGLEARRVDTDEGPRAVVEVSDEGVGMDAALLARVFEPGFTTKPPGSGTGLGLAIALGTARAHGGRLTARSTPGAGTTFTLELPLV